MTRRLFTLVLTSMCVGCIPLVSIAQDGAEKPAEAKAAKLTKTQFANVNPGMTLAEVMALFGPTAQINPDPAPLGSVDNMGVVRPLAYAAPEVLVVWREGNQRWAGVIFVPDRDRVLRVLDVCYKYANDLLAE